MGGILFDIEMFASPVTILLGWRSPLLGKIGGRADQSSQQECILLIRDGSAVEYEFTDTGQWGCKP